MSDPKPYNPDGVSLDTGNKKLGKMEDCYGADETDLDIVESDDKTVMPTKER